MRIYGNHEAVTIRAEIDSLQQKFATELEATNNLFNPEFIKLKAKRNNIIYYLVMTFFLFIFISLSVFLGSLEAFWLIVIAYSVNAVISGLGLFFLRRTNKAFVLIKEEWDKEYRRVLNIKDEIQILFEKQEIEVYKVIALTENKELLDQIKDQDIYNSTLEKLISEVKMKIIQELGNNYTAEAVSRYYLEWGENLTSGGASYDFLEARRKKAILQSKKTNIDQDENESK